MSEVVELNTELVPVEFEYVYITIPAEYVCVYHRILAMLADYGEEMLKDCKATCKDRNSGVIECFNMFNAAVAARKLGDEYHLKLAETLIKYIKAKINQIYKGKDNSTSFVFPVDENGQLKAFVSCGETPMFYINPDDMELYEHKFHNGFDEHFRLGPEDESDNGVSSTDTTEPSVTNISIQTGIRADRVLDVNIRGYYEKINGVVKPCADVQVKYAGRLIDINDTDYQYYFDDVMVRRFNDVSVVTPGMHHFECVVNYKGITGIGFSDLYYEVNS